MTFGPPERPLPELSTTRVGGGLSARLIAVAIAGLLIAVVGFTVVNRPPAPAAPSPTAPVVAAVPTAVPTPAPPRNQLEGNDGIFGWPVVAQLGDYRGAAQVQRVYQYVAVTTVVSGRVPVLLVPDGPEVYRGSVVIEAAQTGDELSVEVGRQWTELGLQIYEAFDVGGVGLKPLLQSHGRLMTMMVEHVPPDLTFGLPGPLASGYTFTIIGRKTGTQLGFSFELAWAPAAQFAAYSGPRGPGLFNRCRWGNGPQGASPRVNHDEAGCLDG